MFDGMCEKKRKKLKLKQINAAKFPIFASVPTVNLNPSFSRVSFFFFDAKQKFENARILLQVFCFLFALGFFLIHIFSDLVVVVVVFV